MHNPLVLNPAIAGTAEGVSMVFLHRNQWVGFEGAPATQTFSIHGPLRNKLQMMGLGLHIINDKLGPINNYGISGSVAYKLPIASGKLSVGIRGGLLNHNIDLNKIEYFSGTQSVQKNKNNRFLSTFDLGLLYYTKTFYLGTAISHLFRPKITENTPGNNIQGHLERHFIATSNYDIILNQFVIFKPSVLFKYVKNSPVDLDINANFLFHNNYWLGAGYRLNYGAIFLAGINIADKLKVGYSFDASFNKIKKIVGGSHEIFISYDLKKKSPEIKLYLVTEEGVIIMTAIKDKKGYFFFGKLPSEKNYIFMLETDDLELIDEVQVKLTNKEGKEVIITANKEKNKFFRYTHLPYQETKLYAINKEMDTVMVAVRNEDGSFVFKLLPDDPDYVFSLESYDDSSSVNEINILINGKSIKLKKGEDIYFRYEKLPVEDVKLYLLDINGDTLGTGTLNDDGFFIFSTLPADKDYLFLLNAKDAGLIDEVQIMYIDDKKEKVIITAIKGADKFFKYEHLQYKEAKLHLISEEGDTLMSVIRNKDGFFLFKELPSDKNYIFLLDNMDTTLIDDILILFRDKKGKETLITATKETANRFKYHCLPGSKNGKLELIDKNDVPVILEEWEEKIVNTVFESLKFNTGEAIIRYESFPYLEKLSDLLIKRQEWKIKLSGHTDDVGRNRFNLLLSKKRAEAVKRALVKRSVPPKRIIVKYYGETKPVADNSSENGRQKNRRVEMLIVK